MRVNRWMDELDFIFPPYDIIHSRASGSDENGHELPPGYRIHYNMHNNMIRAQGTGARFVVYKL